MGQFFFHKKCKKSWLSSHLAFYYNILHLMHFLDDIYCFLCRIPQYVWVVRSSKRAIIKIWHLCQCVHREFTFSLAAYIFFWCKKLNMKSWKTQSDFVWSQLRLIGNSIWSQLRLRVKELIKDFFCCCYLLSCQEVLSHAVRSSSAESSAVIYRNVALYYTAYRTKLKKILCT